MSMPAGVTFTFVFTQGQLVYIQYSDGKVVQVPGNMQLWGKNWANIAAALYCKGNTGAPPGPVPNPTPKPSPTPGPGPGYPKPPGPPGPGPKPPYPPGTGPNTHSFYIGFKNGRYVWALKSKDPDNDEVIYPPPVSTP